MAEKERDAIVEDPLVVARGDVDEDDRQDHVPQKNFVRREREIDALVGVAGVRKGLAVGNVGRNREILTRRRGEAIDDVDVQRGVGVLVVVVGMELDRDAGQDRVRDRLGPGRRRPNLGAYAVVVAVVLVEDDSIGRCFRPLIRTSMASRRVDRIPQGDLGDME